MLNAEDVEVLDDELLAVATLQPAKPRPKRLKVIKAKSGADRMKAATAKAREVFLIVISPIMCGLHIGAVQASAGETAGAHRIRGYYRAMNRQANVCPHQQRPGNKQNQVGT